MEKIKQLSLKAMLLTFLAATLTFGFSSCTEEIGSDTTTGKPGYLTINVKTLKTKQSKVGGDGALDYQAINDLNIFVFTDSTDNATLITHKYFEGNAVACTNGVVSQGLSIPIPATSITDSTVVVAVANYSSEIAASITTLASLEALEVPTVRDFANSGLHMTGIAKIKDDGNNVYTSHVHIAPVESKITVNWTMGQAVQAHYVVTGIYVVNAVGKTKLPIIRQDLAEADPTDKPITKNISAATAVNMSGFAHNRTTGSGFYETMGTTETNTNLFNKPTSPATYFAADSKFHYYVGENYSNTAAPGKTIVLIETTCKLAYGGDTAGVTKRYYTYEFDTSSAGTVNAAIGTEDGIKDGFSTRRKTNYNLTFKLSTIGTKLPFVKTTDLNVTVTADEWQNAGVNPTF